MGEVVSKSSRPSLLAGAAVKASLAEMSAIRLLHSGPRIVRRGQRSRAAQWTQARSCSGSRDGRTIVDPDGRAVEGVVDPAQLQTKLVPKAPPSMGAYLGAPGMGNIVVNGYTEYGFKINENFVAGAAFLTPKQYLSWNVKTLDDVTDESLALPPRTNPADWLMDVIATDES